MTYSLFLYTRKYFCSFYFLPTGNKPAMIGHAISLSNPALNHFINKYSKVEQLNLTVTIFKVLSRFYTKCTVSLLIYF